jgi:hypothetical protein
VEFTRSLPQFYRMTRRKWDPAKYAGRKPLSSVIDRPLRLVRAPTGSQHWKEGLLHALDAETGDLVALLNPLNMRDPATGWDLSGSIAENGPGQRKRRRDSGTSLATGASQISRFDGGSSSAPSIQAQKFARCPERAQSAENISSYVIRTVI